MPAQRLTRDSKYRGMVHGGNFLEGSAVARERQVCHMFDMTKEQVKEILDRVLTWPRADQEKGARFAREVEQWRDDEDITEEEWRIIEERAARRDLASDEEVEAVFSRYRNA